MRLLRGVGCGDELVAVHDARRDTPGRGFDLSGPRELVCMAGFPLFAHVGREKINSTAPLKATKFPGSKTKSLL